MHGQAQFVPLCIRPSLRCRTLAYSDLTLKVRHGCLGPEADATASLLAALVRCTDDAAIQLSGIMNDKVR